LSNILISYVAFYVGPIQTGFLMTFQKSYGGTGIVIPVKKSATGAEKTGIRRIPAGIGNPTDLKMSSADLHGRKKCTTTSRVKNMDTLPAPSLSQSTGLSSET
jgi:hypothetical protein